MLDDQQIKHFHDNGFVRGSQALSESQVSALQDEMARVIADKDDPAAPQPVLLRNMNPDTAPVWQIVDIWHASDRFHALLTNPTILEELAQLTHAHRLRLWHDQVQYKPAATGGVNMWHQDGPLWPILAPKTQVTAWVALDDVDPENGCMSMVPGSHLWGDHMDYLKTLTGFDAVPSKYEGHAVAVQTCPVKRGEVHYHHALTWHGSQANRSGRPRRAVALHYMTEETRYVPGGSHVMEQFIQSPAGEELQGEMFPLAWQRPA